MGEKVICSQCGTDAEPAVLVLKNGALVYPETYRNMPRVPMDTKELREASQVCAWCVSSAALRGVPLHFLVG
jgi:hypothetical protein